MSQPQKPREFWIDDRDNGDGYVVHEKKPTHVQGELIHVREVLPVSADRERECYAKSDTLGCRLENFGGKCECANPAPQEKAQGDEENAAEFLERLGMDGKKWADELLKIHAMNLKVRVRTGSFATIGNIKTREKSRSIWINSNPILISSTKKNATNQRRPRDHVSCDRFDYFIGNHRVSGLDHPPHDQGKCRLSAPRDGGDRSVRAPRVRKEQA